MISTNSHLPIRTPMDPINDETSGIANLDRREARALRVIDTTVTFCIGMVLGALLAAAAFVIGNL